MDNDHIPLPPFLRNSSISSVCSPSSFSFLRYRNPRLKFSHFIKKKQNHTSFHFIHSIIRFFLPLFVSYTTIITIYHYHLLSSSFIALINIIIYIIICHLLFHYLFIIITIVIIYYLLLLFTIYYTIVMIY